MISYPFPPLGVAGSIRPYRFVKYLPNFSWEPIVLTINERNDVPKDYSLLQRLSKNVRVVRARYFDPLLVIQSCRNYIQKIDNDSVERIARNDVSGELRKRRSYFFSKNVKKFLLSLITTPDHQVFWLPFALVKSASLINKNSIKAIMSTSPPHSSHLIALILKMMCNIPWIADFRDPWVENFKLRNGLLTWQKRVERLLEKLVMDHADIIIANTEKNRKNLIKRYSNLNAKKFITIHNGFERYDINKKLNFNKFTITHTGIFYQIVKPYFFFEALAKWLSTKDNKFKSKVQVLLVGEEANGATEDVIKKNGLGEVVRFIDRLPQKYAFEIACSSDMLLVSLGFNQENNGWVPMKLYDYLHCGRPILSFLPDGEAAQIVRSTKTGYVINSPDLERTIKILENEFQNKFSIGRKEYRLEPDYNEINLYEVEYLTGRLAKILKRILR